MVLDDEDFSHGIMLYLLEISKKTSVHAQEIIDYVQLPDVQEKLTCPGLKSNISLQTAQRWLKKLGWRYGRKRNGMYLNGHEWEDVVNHRKVFVARWAEYEKHMVQYGNDRKIATIPSRFAVEQVSQFCLILLTHNKSTFFTDDRHKNSLHAPGSKQTPKRKHEVESLMVSEFLSPEWGSLRDDEEGCVHHVFQLAYLTFPNPERLGFSFRLERTVKVTLTTKTCSNRLIGPSISLNLKLKVSPQACGSSIIHLAIKSGLQMVCLLEKCRRSPTKVEPM